jgi:uncharacterized protein YdeI (YjbR/CyaY-like superfamily)
VTECAPLDFRSTAEWRRWLRRNHARSDGEWVFIYKKDANRTGLRYQDALDEALCFGWIDGQVRAVDRDRFRQRWTPRRKRSIWSESNKARVRRLVAAGRLAAAGLAQVRAAKRDGRWARVLAAPRLARIPPALATALRADPQAARNFARLAPSYRRLYNAWVADAKQDATRRRRVEAIVRRSRENRKPNMVRLYD